MKLYINTLGEFDIKANGQSILEQTNRSYKLFKLFEYFLTFRNKKLLPENIIDNLLSESESDDPKNILRTQIFRLRKIIKLILPKDMDESKYLTLNFLNGYYNLETGENVLIDVDDFEDFIKKGEESEKNNNILDAIEYYEKAMELYKGVYLSDNAYEVWLMPTRNFYQRLYQKTLSKLLELLKIIGNDEKIILLCEKSLMIEPYDELIHENLMESMINLGQNKAALHHYEYAFKLLEKDLDAKPSEHYVNFFNRIQNQGPRKDADINNVKNLDEELVCGALRCDFSHFKLLYNLEKRKLLRNNTNTYLCIINCLLDRNIDINKWDNFLEKTLRKDDAFTFSNEKQMLILLHNVKGNGLDTIRNRIFQNINNNMNVKKEEIRIVFQPLFEGNV